MKHPLNKIFDKIYILNMTNDAKQIKNVEEELKGIDFELFSSITQEEEDLHKNQKLFIKQDMLRYNLSHLKILKQAKEQKLKNVLIFEENIILDKDHIRYNFGSL